MNDMKIVAMLGGLGSQMFKYAFFLAIKEECSDEKCIIDTTPFLTREMWNGYELERIFHIHENDLADSFCDNDINTVGKDFYRKVSLNQIHILYPNSQIYYFERGKKYEYKDDSAIYYRLFNKIRKHIKLCLDSISQKENSHIDVYPKDYLSLNGITYYDEFNHTSDYYFHSIRNKLIDVFDFPEFCDEKNKIIANEMLNRESVALHIRRSDHLYDNIQLFEDGYFKKAIDYIKSKVRNPVFYIFSDEPDWCVSNKETIGISCSDNIVMVDWNSKAASFRDMQLMTYCKHNILVISSFSWWGYYLSRNTNGKIVCAPNGYWFDVNTHF